LSTMELPGTFFSFRYWMALTSGRVMPSTEKGFSM
jgi:hypothetical protein